MKINTDTTFVEQIFTEKSYGNMPKKRNIFVGADRVAVNIFTSKYVPVLENFMSDPNIHFLLSDSPGLCVLAARHLANRRFRECTLYHLGDTPSHNIGDYKKIGGFTSYIEIEEFFRDIGEPLKC